MFFKESIQKLLLSVFLLGSLAACEEVATVSILKETEDFVQAASKVDNKIDILWIVDNSGSMGDSQTALAQNFEAFIEDIEQKGYDFQIAVITTDAYRGGDFARFKAAGDGTRILTPNTPDLKTKFIEAIMVGIRGSADERGMQSLEVAFENSANQLLDFPRRDAFFSVIVVSDEEDNSRMADGSRVYPGKNHYLGILDTIRLSDSINGEQNYSVNAIVKGPANPHCTSGIVGNRYMEMVEATGGITADICGDFANSLTNITTSIVQLSTQFYLSREPVIESIKVIVNDLEVPNDENNGWTYHADSNSIKFHGNAVPSQGASIAIDFDPLTLIN